MVNSTEPVDSPREPALRGQFRAELEAITSEVIRLGALASETIPRGTEALLTADLADAQALINDDDEIDRLSVELEERCYALIALQQPMASDLRRVITITKLIGEIERSADLMVNVCKAARRMYGATLTPRCRGILTGMSQEANKMVRLSIDAFADENASLAVALDDIDDELDQLNRDMVEAIFESHNSDEVDLRTAVQLALIARYYERIGDHAVNIGQRVNFMVTGWMPEHTGQLRAEHRANKPAVETSSTPDAGSEPADSAGSDIWPDDGDPSGPA